MRTLTAILPAAVLLAALSAGAARAEDPAPAGPQVVVPELDRRDVRPVRIPSRDFVLGAFAGTYSADGYGSNPVTGVRLGYHVSEDAFVEATLGQTLVSDTAYRQILPGGIFPSPKQWLRYYDLSFGYNLLPGEIFLGRNIAKVSAVYVEAGMGNTQFLQESHQTFQAGLGMRVFLRDWAAVQVDMRDHVFSSDLLGTRRTTQNLELSAGLTFFF